MVEVYSEQGRTQKFLKKRFYKVSRQKWLILLHHAKRHADFSFEFDYYCWFEPELILPLDCCLTMSAISTITITKQEFLGKID